MSVNIDAIPDLLLIPQKLRIVQYRYGSLSEPLLLVIIRTYVIRGIVFEDKFLFRYYVPETNRKYDTSVTQISSTSQIRRSMHTRINFKYQTTPFHVSA